MVPQTIGALVAFLALVAPGVVYELNREHKRSSITESSFREASRVALASFAFTAVSCLVMWAVWLTWPSGAVDLRGWLARGTPYLEANLLKIFLTTLGEVSLACLLAAVVARVVAVLANEGSSISNDTAWQVALRRDRPERKSKVWVHVRLRDETEFYGYLEWYTVGEKPDDREILLEGAALARRVPVKSGETPEAETIGETWEKVLIPASQITYLRVCYQDEFGEPVLSKRRLGEKAPLSTAE